MKECSKSILRRLSNPNFIRLYFKGKGIDIGGKPDPLALYIELFPLVTEIYIWDKDDGDAQFVSTVKDCYYDFVHSSHCLEHLEDPYEGLNNWVRILKPNGYLIITVPDEDMYEQGNFPSKFNKDHKWTFTIYKKDSWSCKSINLIDLFKSIDNISIEKIELLNSTYREFSDYDQTLSPVTESGIEIIVRKTTDKEKKNKGNIVDSCDTPSSLKKYLDQYIKDHNTIIKNNILSEPFKDEN